MNTIIALLNWFIRKWNGLEERRKKKKHDDRADALRNSIFPDTLRKQYLEELEKSASGFDVNTSFTSSTSSLNQRKRLRELELRARALHIEKLYDNSFDIWY